MGTFDATVGVLLLGLLDFKDAYWVRCIVYVLFVVVTAHSAVSMYAAWKLCIVNFAKPESLEVIGWTLPFTAIATSVTALLTQTFLAHRVYILTKGTYCVAVIGVSSLLSFIFGIYTGTRAGVIQKMMGLARLSPFAACWLGFQTFTDLLISVRLIYAFARSRTGHRNTDTMVNRLIRGAVQTGFLVSVFALADLFSFLLHRNTYLYAMFTYPLGCIYTTTLLDTLNSRIELKTMSNNARGFDGRVE
ncbi:hypothetical protein HYPSUDRAFT_197290 [Hypholoma sublateritium FD-334 SS-4]|uniref:DUF6534 domain-containing protein n=1 Tax=Hypholoma sublateritium (strain FD-334 SS-4) TaxID=945553 RepID=A0A0D2LKU7_HYPSF|nr:hypothetical protein HYPSUDRAFT_197290 [Hypholoma sublateritium FD-334 SS-4]